jgi:hypothetical protein
MTIRRMLNYFIDNAVVVLEIFFRQNGFRRQLGRVEVVFVPDFFLRFYCFLRHDNSPHAELLYRQCLEKDLRRGCSCTWKIFPSTESQYCSFSHLPQNSLSRNTALSLTSPKSPLAAHNRYRPGRESPSSRISDLADSYSRSLGERRKKVGEDEEK